MCWCLFEWFHIEGGGVTELLKLEIWRSRWTIGMFHMYDLHKIDNYSKLKHATFVIRCTSNYSRIILVFCCCFCTTNISLLTSLLITFYFLCRSMEVHCRELYSTINQPYRLKCWHLPSTYSTDARTQILTVSCLQHTDAGSRSYYSCRIYH